MAAATRPDVGGGRADDVDDAELVAMVNAIQNHLSDIELHLAEMERSSIAQPLRLLPDHTDHTCPESFAETVRQRRPMKREVVSDLIDGQGHVSWQKVDAVLTTRADHRDDLRSAYFDALRLKVREQRRQIREMEAKKLAKQERNKARLLKRYQESNAVGHSQQASRSGAPSTVSTQSIQKEQHQHHHQQHREPPPCSGFYFEVEREYREALRARRAGKQKKAVTASARYVTDPIQRTAPKPRTGVDNRAKSATALPPVVRISSDSKQDVMGLSPHKMAVLSLFGAARSGGVFKPSGRGPGVEERRAAERLGSTLELRRILDRAAAQIEMTQRLMEELDVFPVDHEGERFKPQPLPDIRVVSSRHISVPRAIAGSTDPAGPSINVHSIEPRGAPPRRSQEYSGSGQVDQGGALNPATSGHSKPVDAAARPRLDKPPLVASELAPVPAPLSMAELESELPLLVAGAPKLWRPPFLGSFAGKTAT